MQELIKAAAKVLEAAGFHPAEYDRHGRKVTRLGFVIEETEEPGTLYIARDQYASLPARAEVRQQMAKAYARELDAAGWRTQVRSQFLLARRP